MSATTAPFRLPEAPVEADLVAKYFRGLGDPIRLRILELLRAEGELTVSQLVERLGIAQPKVSTISPVCAGVASSRRAANTAPSSTSSATSGSFGCSTSRMHSLPTT